MAPGGRPRRRKTGGARRYYLAVGMFVLVVVPVMWYAYVLPQPGPGTNNTSTTGIGKPVILYVNQGNGAVDLTNFNSMAAYAASHGFNTVFLQVYRQGVLLFGQQDLGTFVSQARLMNLKIYFALWITNSSQQIPSSIYGLGEDGISLDVSTIALASQQSLLASLKASYGGRTAVTTTDMNSPLKQNLLVLETYGISLQPFIRHGTVGSVGVFATSSGSDYQSQFQYALQNSDGVMVFDYAGLVRSGY